MKPIRIFILLFIVFLFVGLISLLIPGHDIKILKGFSVKIPSMGDLFCPHKAEYANIASVLQVRRSDTDSLVRIVKTDTLKKSDSLSIKLVSQPLDYPGNDKTILYPFFRELNESLISKKGIHILHYGDSQLEGDRITDYLRSRFQAEFGGSGPGMLPIGEEAYRLAILSSASGNWEKHILMGNKYKDQGPYPYGPMGSYYCFTSGQKDSTWNTNKLLEAWITYSGKGSSGGKTDQYKQCRIFYKNNHKAAKVSFFSEDVRLKSDTLQASRSLKEYDLSFVDTPSNLTIRFSGTGTPYFYGICLDSPSGISVDNIPIRGSSGLEFTRMDSTLMTEIYRILNVRLLILQFGVNVIPGDLDDYTWYENGFCSQLIQLKKLNPGLNIIVIGVSDASRKNGDTYESYACVEKILNAQKAAAFRAGCAFWNLYAAMGGKNSMPSWVFTKEPLATTDFLHFNYEGARIVGKMFYSALINDYNEFIRRNQR
jgi:hypothetical protein